MFSLLCRGHDGGVGVRVSFDSSRYLVDLFQLTLSSKSLLRLDGISNMQDPNRKKNGPGSTIRSGWRAARLIFSCMIFLSITGAFQPVDAAKDPKVKAAIERGLQYLRQYDLKFKPATGLIVYTLLSGGDAPDSPAVQRGLDLILGKFRGSESDLTYRPQHHHIYEAAIDVMALEAADAEGYLDHIKAISDYIINSQLEIGAWFYPYGGRPGEGDTSITQYAVLGLWAAHRAGVEIPLEVFEKAALWHFRTQDKTGGFTYHPVLSANGAQSDRGVSGTMTGAGSGTLGIIRFILFRDQPPQLKEDKKAGNGPRFGVLEAQIPKKPEKKFRRIPKPIKPKIDSTNARARGWLTASFAANLVSEHGGNFFYYFYTLERTSTVNGWETYGSHDWYREGTAVLLPKQAANGSWPELRERASVHPVATCFTLLFLMRATNKLMPARKIPAHLGEGVLAGGRGLPDDLSQVEFRNGKLQYKKEELGDFDNLLAGLATIDLSQADVEVKQTEKKVDISDPRKLIGDVELLKSLVKYRDPRVRQVAAWAIGRTDRLELAELLLPLLKDEDLGVAIEARLALCWISRRPNGFNNPVDPLEEYEDSDVVVDKKKITANWQNRVYKAWRNWYLNSRPYEERDDFDDPEQVRFQK